jgi:hypothetical protein
MAKTTIHEVGKVTVVDNLVEVPADVYERFLNLGEQIINMEIDPEIARFEIIALLSPYWDHIPESWEHTEVALAPKTRSFSSGKVLN